MSDDGEEARLLQGTIIASRAPLELVLDTNVVLDWLAFGHPIGAALEGRLIGGDCRWLHTRAMRDELAGVLVRDSLRRWAIDAVAVLAVVDTVGIEVDAPPPLGATERLQCSDPDDQPFIDLSVARRAHALLTRDRAVLRLASRARGFGVTIATPEAWLRCCASRRVAEVPGGASQAAMQPGRVSVDLDRRTHDLRCLAVGSAQGHASSSTN